MYLLKTSHSFQSIILGLSFELTTLTVTHYDVP